MKEDYKLYSQCLVITIINNSSIMNPEIKVGDLVTIKYMKDPSTVYRVASVNSHHVYRLEGYEVLSFRASDLELVATPNAIDYNKFDYD